MVFCFAQEYKKFEEYLVLALETHGAEEGMGTAPKGALERILLDAIDCLTKK